MDKFSFAHLMGHSSPRVAGRYYIHVTEAYLITGFERFTAYQTAGLVKCDQAGDGEVATVNVQLGCAGVILTPLTASWGINGVQKRFVLPAHQSQQ